MAEVLPDRQPRKTDEFIDLLTGAMRELDNLQRAGLADERPGTENPAQTRSLPERQPRRLVPDTDNIARVGKVTIHGSLTSTPPPAPEVYDETTEWWQGEGQRHRFDYVAPEWPREEQKPPFHQTGHPTTETTRFEPVSPPAAQPDMAERIAQSDALTLRTLRPVPPPPKLQPVDGTL